MSHGSFEDCLTQVLAPSSVVVDMRIQADQSPVVVEPNLVLGGKRMPLTSRDHVLISIKHTSHWSTGLVSRNRHLSSKTNRSTLFASESTSQSPDPGRDAVLGNSESWENQSGISSIHIKNTSKPVPDSPEATNTWVSEGFCVLLYTSISSSGWGIAKVAFVSI